MLPGTRALRVEESRGRLDGHGVHYLRHMEEVERRFREGQHRQMMIRSEQYAEADARRVLPLKLRVVRDRNEMAKAQSRLLIAMKELEGFEDEPLPTRELESPDLPTSEAERACPVPLELMVEALRVFGVVADDDELISQEELEAAHHGDFGVFKAGLSHLRMRILDPQLHAYAVLT